MKNTSVSSSTCTERRLSAAGMALRSGCRDGEAEVSIPVRPEFYHAAHAVHGSVYFRALDDAAFMAVNSRVRDVLVVTVGFSVHFTAPVSEGELLATGRVVHESGRLFVAESEVRDGEGRLLAKGSGTFTRSRIPLSAEVGYRESAASQNSLGRNAIARHAR